MYYMYTYNHSTPCRNADTAELQQSVTEIEIEIESQDALVPLCRDPQAAGLAEALLPCICMYIYIYIYIYVYVYTFHIYIYIYIYI